MPAGQSVSWSTNMWSWTGEAKWGEYVVMKSEAIVWSRTSEANTWSWKVRQICGHEQVRQSEANMWSRKVRQLCGQEQVRQICGHEKWGKPIHQGCSVRGSVKSSGSQTFTHFNKPLKCRLWAIKSSSNFMPVFRIYRSKIAAQNAGKSLRWPSNVLIFSALINYNILYTCKTIQACLDEYDHETSKILHFRKCTSNCSNSSRVLELSRTLSNPCSQKVELNNPAKHTHTKPTSA